MLQQRVNQSVKIKLKGGRVTVKIHQSEAYMQNSITNKCVIVRLVRMRRHGNVEVIDDGVEDC